MKFKVFFLYQIFTNALCTVKIKCNILTIDYLNLSRNIFVLLDGDLFSLNDNKIHCIIKFITVRVCDVMPEARASQTRIKII